MKLGGLPCRKMTFAQLVPKIGLRRSFLKIALHFPGNRKVFRHAGTRCQQKTRSLIAQSCKSYPVTLKLVARKLRKINPRQPLPAQTDSPASRVTFLM
jgi:hypothetical protein